MVCWQFATVWLDVSNREKDESIVNMLARTTQSILSANLNVSKLAGKFLSNVLKMEDAEKNVTGNVKRRCQVGEIKGLFKLYIAIKHYIVCTTPFSFTPSYYFS